MTAVRGWNLRETGGIAVATVRLWDGTSVRGNKLATIHLVAGESDTQWLTGGGLAAYAGVFLEVVSGSVEGTLWYSVGEHADDFLWVQGAKAHWAGEE
jgi:hypothetical protein